MSACVVVGCETAPKAGCRGYCKKHYTAQWKYGDPLVTKARPHRVKPAKTVRVKCRVCEQEFDCPNSRGQLRAMCDKQCVSVACHQAYYIRMKKAPKCEATGCDRGQARPSYGLCEMHYGRRRRNGNLEGPDPKYRSVDGAGYVVCYAFKAHPLADKDGKTREHRLVAYSKHDGVCPPCGWCGMALEWKHAVVDHMNDVKADNRPENLLVSCSACNRARAMVSVFVRRLTLRGLDRMTDTIVQAWKDEQAKKLKAIA